MIESSTRVSLEDMYDDDAYAKKKGRKNRRQKNKNIYSQDDMATDASFTSSDQAASSEGLPAGNNGNKEDRGWFRKKVKTRPPQKQQEEEQEQEQEQGQEREHEVETGKEREGKKSGSASDAKPSSAVPPPPPTCSSNGNNYASPPSIPQSEVDAAIDDVTQKLESGASIDASIDPSQHLQQQPRESPSSTEYSHVFDSNHVTNIDAPYITKLELHEEEDAGVGCTVAIDSDEEDEDVVLIYKCELCNKTFKSSGAHSSHLKSKKHRDKVKEIERNEKRRKRKEEKDKKAKVGEGSAAK